MCFGVTAAISLQEFSNNKCGTKAFKKKSDRLFHKAIIGHYDCHDHRIRVQDLSSDTENVTVQRKQFITSASRYKIIQRKK